MTSERFRSLAFGLFLALVAAMALPRAQAPQPVTGVVFEDANGNGHRDAGERGLADVVVSNQREVVRTRADGAYELAGRGYGVVFVSLPDGFRAVGPFWKPAPSDSAAPIEFALAPHRAPAEFSFIHGSDPHVNPANVDRLRQVRSIVESRRPEFVLMTGDLVRDSLRVGEEEARGYYDLYLDEIRQFPVPVWNVPGNHDNFGIERHLSHVSPTHPLYGKAMYRQRVGPNYYSFTYGGIHFVGLDTVDIADQWYYGHVDDAQLAWLRADLAAVPADTPIVTFDHIPFLSAVDEMGGYEEGGPAPTLLKLGDRTVFRHVVSNFPDVLAVMASRNWPLALGGHFHTRESIRYSSNVTTRFELAAAITGPTDNPVPAISGITLYRVRNKVIDAGEFIALSGLKP
ncbi:MAG TPA: metallophosphoesterase [Vicinamibacterales bacterium]|nr:metallophosphoesterase [Vicinamibacterales bacterium]